MAIINQLQRNVENVSILCALSIIVLHSLYQAETSSLFQHPTFALTSNVLGACLFCVTSTLSTQIYMASLV